MWRTARIEDDSAIVAHCLDLYAEDPGPVSVHAAQVQRTLDTLRAEPSRGRVVVLDLAGQIAGYALLLAVWSNELGGEVCVIDELFVAPAHRRRGHGSALFAAIERHDIWQGPLVGLALGVTPGNADALRLYQRLGFEVVGSSLLRRR